jgi:hypothetical protein
MGRKTLCRLQACDLRRQPATFDAEELIKDLPTSRDSHYRILDCGMKSFPIEALSHSPLTAMMKTVKEQHQG